MWRVKRSRNVDTVWWRNIGKQWRRFMSKCVLFHFFRVTGREVHNWDWGTSDVCEKNSAKDDFKPKVHFVIKLVGRFRKWVFLHAGCLRITRALHLESKTAGMQNYFLCLFHRGHIKPFGPLGVFYIRFTFWGLFELPCWLAGWFVSNWKLLLQLPPPIMTF